MPAPPTVDPDTIRYLRELSPGDNGAFLREIIGIFLADTPLRLAELDEGLKASDPAKFARAAHSIKGSSSNLGAAALRALAEQLEDQSRTRPLGEMAPLIAGLRGEFGRVRVELERLLRPGAA